MLCNCAVPPAIVGAVGPGKPPNTHPRPGFLDNACSLTGARYSVITLLHDEGRIQDFLTSGLTPEPIESEVVPVNSLPRTGYGGSARRRCGP